MLYITDKLLQRIAEGHVNMNLVYGPSYNHTHVDFRTLYDHTGRNVISYFSGTSKYGNFTIHRLMNMFQRHPGKKFRPKIVSHDHTYRIFEKVELLQPKGFRISIPPYPYIRHFDVYVSINEPFLDFVNPYTFAKISGQIWQCDANGDWVYENTYTDLRKDDEVHYNLLVVMTDMCVYTKFDNMFVVTRGPDGKIEFCTERQALMLDYK